MISVQHTKQNILADGDEKKLQRWDIYLSCLRTDMWNQTVMVVWFKASREAEKQNVINATLIFAKIPVVLVIAGLKICVR